MYNNNVEISEEGGSSVGLSLNIEQDLQGLAFEGGEPFDLLRPEDRILQNLRLSRGDSGNSKDHCGDGDRLFLCIIINLLSVRLVLVVDPKGFRGSPLGPHDDFLAVANPSLGIIFLGDFLVGFDEGEFRQELIGDRRIIPQDGHEVVQRQ